MKYDEEEKEILELFESGSIKLSTPSEEEIAAIKQCADAEEKGYREHRI